MPSTLYSVYTAQRSLSLNQAAIDIINSNIANMNTKGYSKQRLEISQMSNISPYENPIDASQSGLGAVVDNITRNRDVFLDNSLRKELSDLNYYQKYNETSSQIEDVVNELGDTGLNKTLNDFYNSLSQLSANPNDYVARNSVVQNAITLCNNFNNTYTGLQNLRTGLVGDISNPETLNQSKLSIEVNELNNKLSAVANLNDQINVATAKGLTPNALLDQRDLLLDQISELIPVSIKNEANNTVTLKLGTVELVSGKERTGLLEIGLGDINNPSTVKIVNEAGSTLLNNAYSIISSGKIGAILQAGGSDTSKLTIKGLMDSLNTLAGEFATAINTVQTGGRYIDNTVSPHELSDNISNPFVAPGPGVDAEPEDFFVDSDASGTITAGNISVNSVITNNPYQISAASLTGGINETGDGSNALLMSQVRNKNIALIGGTTTQGYLTNLTGKLGTQSKNLADNYEIKNNITQQITQKRESVIGVNLDEELTDLVRFQRSYEASARVMTTINQTLSTIINMMG